MKEEETVRPLERLEQDLGSSWENLRRAREKARFQRQQLEEALSTLVPEDTTIVVFGSLARDEVTSGSDIDWTLLVDGLASPRHIDASFDIEYKLEELELKEPGQEGTFGGLAFSHDILHRIGGGDDTNKNTTQRVLLLLESAPIGRAEAYERVIRQLLMRYITEDWGWMHHKVAVPRFLLNDIARYWRTVAVDFAYKRRQRQGKGWALRTIKLRMSRKITYASGLLACFSCAIQDPEVLSGSSTDQGSTHPIVSYLADLMRKPPLEIVATISGPRPELHNATKLLIDNYDKFVGILDDKEVRLHLEKLPPSEADHDEIYQRARRLSHSFQDALDQIFLQDSGAGILELTKKYGVF